MGHHLERTVFFDESMTASSIDNAVVSGFTWKILEDSGWYGPVDPSLYEPFTAGKGRGCEWRDGCHNSKNMDFFCDANHPKDFTFDGRKSGYCASDNFMDAD